MHFVSELKSRTKSRDIGIQVRCASCVLWGGGPQKVVHVTRLCSSQKVTSMAPTHSKLQLLRSRISSEPSPVRQRAGPTQAPCRPDDSQYVFHATPASVPTNWARCRPIEDAVSETDPQRRFHQQVLIDTTPLPDDVPAVKEVGASSAPLLSASFFIGARCRDYNDDYMQCKTQNPGRGEFECMKEGRRVTRCATSVYVYPITCQLALK